MSNQLLASKVVTQNGQPSRIQAPTFNTAVAGFIGIAQKGPVGEAVQCTSYTEFYNTFGGYIAGSYLAIAVAAFFAGGGSVCWVVRTVHYTNIDSAASKTSAKASTTLTTDAIAATAASNTCANAGPYVLANGQTIVAVIDSEAAVTTTISATAASRTATNAGTYALSNGHTITVKVDGGAVQTIAFLTAEFVDIGAATAAEVAAVLNAKIAGASCDVSGGKPRITSDSKGTGSKIEVTGGTGNTAIAFATAEVVGTGNVSNVAAATATEVAAALTSAIGTTATISLVGGAVKITSKTTGSGSHVQVTSASTATALGFDNATHTGDTSGTLNTLTIEGKYDGAYANSLRPVVAAATSGVAGEFNLTLQTTAGVVVEVFPNIVIGAANASADNYVETVVNNENTGSKWIAATDLEAATSAVNAVPVVGTGAALTGGLDGLSDNGSIGDTDFIGSEASLTGLRAFDGADDLTLLGCPDRATAAVHLAMLTYCGTTRNGQPYAIIDPPTASTTQTAIRAHVNTYLLEVTERAEIYWPRWQITNPNKTAYGTADKITVPLCGHIAGMFAKVDGARVGGIYDVPGGPDLGKLPGLLNPDPNTGDAKTGGAQREAVRDLLYPNRINPVWSGTGIPVCKDGARTLKANCDWPTTAQSRGMYHIMRTCKAMMQPFRIKRRDDDLLAAEDRTLNDYLATQCGLGAFASKIPAETFWVDMGAALNPRTTPNITQANIGVATAQPNEFVVLNFFEDANLGA